MDLATEIPSRVALRYHGGKWLLARWIISHFPPHRVYVEPFGGAASVLLQKPRSYAEIYNDLDQDVVNFFRVLRDPAHAAALQELLRLTPFSRGEFYAARQLADDPIERARRLVVRSFMGFGSAATNINYSTGFRSNSHRSGTTPAKDWSNYSEMLLELTARLRGVCIENKCAFSLMPQHDSPETLFYLDPPYLWESRNCSSKAYGENELSLSDHEKLAKAARKLKGYCLISGYRSDLYDSLYSGWQRVEKNAYADGASPRVECLWLNPKLSEQHNP